MFPLKGPLRLARLVILPYNQPDKGLPIVRPLDQSNRCKKSGYLIRNLYILIRGFPSLAGHPILNEGRQYRAAASLIEACRVSCTWCSVGGSHYLPSQSCMPRLGCSWHLEATDKGENCWSASRDWPVGFRRVDKESQCSYWLNNLFLSQVCVSDDLSAPETIGSRNYIPCPCQ